MRRTPRRDQVSRREVLAGLGGVGLAAASAGTRAAAMRPEARAGLEALRDAGGAPAGSAAKSGPVVANRTRVQGVPPRSGAVNVALVRTPAAGAPAARFSRDAGVREIGECIDRAQADLVVLLQSPFRRVEQSSRRELLRAALDVPGPETDAIGVHAKRSGSYVAFACYLRDADWPGHAIDASVLVGPEGRVIARQWKLRHAPCARGESRPVATTICDVLDRYVERYGAESIVSVARTDIGTLALTPGIADPLLHVAQSLQGAELQIVCADTPAADLAAIARTNRSYAIGAGVCDPRGVAIERFDAGRRIARARVPLAAFRRARTLPEHPLAALLPVLARGATLLPGAHHAIP